MKQEDKELLLRDLCARLPYGVKVQTTYINQKTKERSDIGIDVLTTTEISLLIDSYEEHKPYLFPLSSMTEEQKKELFELCRFCIEEDWEGKKREVYAIEISSRADPAYCYDHNFYMWGVDVRAIDWLIKNHFDYRGLIPMGLAINATGLNIY